MFVFTIKTTFYDFCKMILLDIIFWYYDIKNNF
jgi:hypothetical protein